MSVIFSQKTDVKQDFEGKRGLFEPSIFSMVSAVDEWFRYY